MSTWRLVIGIVLILHGLGHALGVLALTSLGNDNWNGRSWLLTDAIGDRPTKVIAVVLWMLGLVIFVVAGFALLEIGFSESLWKPLAVSGAVLSLVALTLFWNAFPALFPNKIGSIAVNAVLLVGILFADWPTEEMLSN